MCSIGRKREDDSPPVAVVHGAEHLLEDTLRLLFFQLGPRLQQHVAGHLTAVEFKLDSLGVNHQYHMSHPRLHVVCTFSTFVVNQTARKCSVTHGQSR